MKDRPWKPNVTVAAVIERDGRFLLVEEETPEGLRFNQPAGHLEEGESLLEATAREALEEAAQHFVPEYLVGIYQWTRPQGDITYLRFAYGGRVDGEEAGRALDDGIVRAVWMTIDEVRAGQTLEARFVELEAAEAEVEGNLAHGEPAIIAQGRSHWRND